MHNRREQKKKSEPENLSADTLKGRQSVRATFRLPPQIIALLSVTADQLGLKKKSLFDQLVEDRNILEQLAAGAELSQANEEQRQQKTFVVSRNSLSSLEYVAKTHGVSRDLLVEISIKRLLPVLNAEQEKQKNRKKILADLEAYLQEGLRLLSTSDRLLGSEDTASRSLAHLLTQYGRAIEEMREQVERGRKIEDFQ
ncbi:hypothetical protein [Desulfobulbus alkaliphilus]|uniref:hypothetical protein n=1 Tax=Desulfobulbus alkaliphilus TaxID=869814 RepID=UPI0019650838|nr:hypothetical protein [Desulfobulbus alkaliphilus]MBM9538763.1 hypothetical protein [Desulfobulbus alkaliphilus]